MFRNLTTLGILVALLAQFGNTADAQHPCELFWSDKGLGEGAVNGDLKLDVSSGETFTLYWYWSTNGPLDSELSTGMGFTDVFVSQPGTIRFDAAETLDFDIIIMQFVVEGRWGGSAGYDGGVSGPAGEVTDNSVIDLACFTVTSDGIVESHTGPLFFDTGYDPDADAFLFAQFELTATASGSVDLIVEPGQFVNGPNEINPNIGTITIAVDQFVLLGDVNLDGLVTLLDIAPFTDRILTGTYQAEADMNQDGAVNLQDVLPFVASIQSP